MEMVIKDVITIDKRAQRCLQWDNVPALRKAGMGFIVVSNIIRKTIVIYDTKLQYS